MPVSLRLAPNPVHLQRRKLSLRSGTIWKLAFWQANVGGNPVHRNGHESLRSYCRVKETELKNTAACTERVRVGGGVNFIHSFFLHSKFFPPMLKTQIAIWFVSLAFKCPFQLSCL